MAEEDKKAEKKAKPTDDDLPFIKKKKKSWEPSKAEEIKPHKKKRPKWVLIVDDEAEVRNKAKAALTEAFDDHVKTVEAADGLEATNKLSYQAFDCILTDIKMPKRDGIHFINWVKESALNQIAPIFIMSEEEVDPEFLEEHKGIQVLTKPLDTKKLVELVRTQLKLGTLDHRVGANTLNILIAASKDFVNKIFETESTLEKPSKKEPDASLPGEINSCMLIKTEGESCHLGLSFDRAIVDKLVEVAGNKSLGLSPDLITEVAINTIFKQLGKAILKLTGDPPSMTEKQIFKNKEDFQFKELMLKGGVIIPIKADFGCIYIVALDDRKPTKYKAS